MKPGLFIQLGATWWTVDPEATTPREHTPAQAATFEQIDNPQTRGGPEWPARRVLDGKGRGVIVSWAVKREFDTVTAMATWLADTLSQTPDFDWQEDALLRWVHEDGVGYTDAEIEWAALRIGSIAHEGPRTVRMQLSLYGPSLEWTALLAVPVWTFQNGDRLLWESGEEVATNAEHELYEPA